MEGKGKRRKRGRRKTSKVSYDFDLPSLDGGLLFLFFLGCNRRYRSTLRGSRSCRRGSARSSCCSSSGRCGGGGGSSSSGRSTGMSGNNDSSSSSSIITTTATNTDTTATITDTSSTGYYYGY